MILQVTDANFEQDVLKSDGLVLVDFWAAWRGECRTIVPILEELADEYRGKATIGRWDVATGGGQSRISEFPYNVRGVPTLLIFKGGQVVERFFGYRDKDVLAQALDKHLGEQNAN